MKYNCHFDAAGSCKPIDVAKLLAGSPRADASLQTSPLPQYPPKIRQQPLVIGPKPSPTVEQANVIPSSPFQGMENPQFLAALMKVNIPDSTGPPRQNNFYTGSVTIINGASPEHTEVKYDTVKIKAFLSDLKDIPVAIALAKHHGLL